MRYRQKFKRSKAGRFLLLCFDIFIAHDSAFNKFPLAICQHPQLWMTSSSLLSQCIVAVTVLCKISLCSLMETMAFRVISMYRRLAMWRSTTDWGCQHCIRFALNTVNVHKASCHCLSRLTFNQQFLNINQENTGVSLHLNIGCVTLFLNVGYSWQPTLPSHFSKQC